MPKRLELENVLTAKQQGSAHFARGQAKDWLVKRIIILKKSVLSAMVMESVTIVKGLVNAKPVKAQVSIAQ